MDVKIEVESEVESVVENDVESDVEIEVEFARKGSKAHRFALYEKLWTLNFKL